MAHEQAADDDGDDARGVDLFAGEVADVGDDEGDGNFNGTVVDPALEEGDKGTDEKADNGSTDEEPDEAKKAGTDCGRVAVDDHVDAELEGEQAGGVVEEAFAFKEVDNALGHADLLGDGGGGDGVSGRDDGTEKKADAPVEGRKEVVRGEGDADGGEEDEAEGEHADGDDVGAELSPGGLPGGGEEERRKEDEEDDVRRKGDAGQAGDEGAGEADQDEDDGIGVREAAGDAGDARDRDHECEQDEFKGLQGAHAFHR